MFTDCRARVVARRDEKMEDRVGDQCPVQSASEGPEPWSRAHRRSHNNLPKHSLSKYLGGRCMHVAHAQAHDELHPGHTDRSRQLLQSAVLHARRGPVSKASVSVSHGNTFNKHNHTKRYLGCYGIPYSPGRGGRARVQRSGDREVYKSCGPQLGQ